MREQLDALDSVLGVDRSTNSDSILDRMEVLPFRAAAKRIDTVESRAIRPPNYGGDDSRTKDDVSVCILNIHSSIHPSIAFIHNCYSYNTS